MEKLFTVSSFSYNYLKSGEGKSKERAMSWTRGCTSPVGCVHRRGTPDWSLDWVSSSKLYDGSLTNSQQGRRLLENDREKEHDDKERSNKRQRLRKREGAGERWWGESNERVGSASPRLISSLPSNRGLDYRDNDVFERVNCL